MISLEGAMDVKDETTPADTVHSLFVTLHDACRRPLMLWSWLIMSSCLGALSVALLVPSLEAISGILCFGLIVLYVIGFGVGAGPIPWVYLSEVLPARFKVTVSYCWQIKVSYLLRKYVICRVWRPRQSLVATGQLTSL